MWDSQGRYGTVKEGMRQLSEGMGQLREVVVMSGMEKCVLCL